MTKKLFTLMPLLAASVVITSCSGTKPQTSTSVAAPVAPKVVESKPQIVKPIPVVFEKRSPKRAVRAPVQRQRIARSPYANSFTNKLSNAALERTRSKVRYDGSYLKIAYPGGDVPANIGVCTDVVIRSYRRLGIDLQEQVHRDMSAAFNAYPNPRKWGLSKPDTNIDHRRVYNLRQFFQRRGAALPITHNPRNYKPGDVVSWMVGPDLPHIGVVVNKPSKADPNRLMVVHNIARGPQLEDMLFAFPITGHYRYTPAHMGNIPSGTYAQKKSSSQKRGMSYDQLVQAANLLGTNTVQAKPRAQPNTVQSNSNILDQVVQLNNANTPVVKATNGSMTLANLSAAEIQSLLVK